MCSLLLRKDRSILVSPPYKIQPMISLFMNYNSKLFLVKYSIEDYNKKYNKNIIKI